MREKKSLFDRIFIQPATAALLPEENLATEIIAFFLDHLDPFRDKFLERIGIRDIQGEWSVHTQESLNGSTSDKPNPVWHGKKPDIALRKSGEVRVLIEVKINAGATWSDDVIQTKYYREYLENQQKRVDRRLILLTRWTPEEELARHCHEPILRFDQIQSWLRETAANSGDLAYLGKQWADHLAKWTMIDVQARHLEALRGLREIDRRGVPELSARLWDAIQAVARRAVGDDKLWRRLEGGQSRPITLGRGAAEFWAEIHRPERNDGSRTDYVQLGAYYGLEGDQIRICGLAFLRGSYLDRFVERHGTQISDPKAVLKDSPWGKDQKLLWLENVAEAPEGALDRIRGGLSSVLDKF